MTLLERWVIRKLGKDRHWGVVRTKQASSSDAVANIARQGFEFYRGMYRERPTNGVRRIKPLFPYYLLVLINLRDEAWKALANTRGVQHLFMNGDKPSRVPDEHVQFFRDRENELGYYAHADHEAPRFSVGDAVQGAGGLFDGCQGIYQGLDGSDHSRVRVLFNILGKPKVLGMSAYDLHAVV